MSKKTIVWAAIIVMVVAGLAPAQQVSDIGIDVGATYVSRYIWRGFDSYANNHSAIQPYADFTFGDSGFRGQVWWSRANGSGFENSEEIDYTLAYGNSVKEGEAHQMDWEVGWIYYNFPDGPTRHSPTADLDYQEMFLSLAWPNICQGGLIPSYTLAKQWADESGRRTDKGYA